MGVQAVFAARTKPACRGLDEMDVIAVFPDLAAEPVVAGSEPDIWSAEPPVDVPAAPLPPAEAADQPPRPAAEPKPEKRRRQPRRRRAAGRCPTVSPLTAVNASLRSQWGSVAVLAAVAAAVWTAVLVVERQPLPGTPGKAEPVAGVRVAADPVAHDGSEETWRQ